MVDLATWVLVFGAACGVFGAVFAVGAISELAKTDNPSSNTTRIAALLMGTGTMCAVFAIAVLHVDSARTAQDLLAGF